VAVTSIKPTSEAVVAFLKVLDRTVKPTRKIELYLGGGAAVLLAYDGSQPTVDVDAIGESTAILRELEDVAGRNSDIHRLTGFYLDIVPPGKFPSAQGWQGRCQPVDIPHLESLRRIVKIFATCATTWIYGRRFSWTGIGRPGSGLIETSKSGWMSTSGSWNQSSWG
jgi:hypothetical protein